MTNSGMKTSFYLQPQDVEAYKG